VLAAGGASAALGAGAPNSQRHNRSNAPTCGAAGAAIATATGASSGTGTGTIGDADTGKMLGTTGASLGGFLSRLPMLVSSMVGCSAIW
jgi:hypothetical protein